MKIIVEFEGWNIVELTDTKSTWQLKARMTKQTDRNKPSYTDRMIAGTQRER